MRHLVVYARTVRSSRRKGPAVKPGVTPPLLVNLLTISPSCHSAAPVSGGASRTSCPRQLALKCVHGTCMPSCPSPPQLSERRVYEARQRSAHHHVQMAPSASMCETQAWVGGGLGTRSEFPQSQTYIWGSEYVCVCVEQPGKTAVITTPPSLSIFLGKVRTRAQATHRLHVSESVRCVWDVRCVSCRCCVCVCVRPLSSVVLCAPACACGHTAVQGHRCAQHGVCCGRTHRRVDPKPPFIATQTARV